MILSTPETKRLARNLEYAGDFEVTSIVGNEIIGTLFVGGGVVIRVTVERIARAN